MVTAKIALETKSKIRNFPVLQTNKAEIGQIDMPIRQPRPQCLYCAKAGHIWMTCFALFKLRQANLEAFRVFYAVHVAESAAIAA